MQTRLLDAYLPTVYRPRALKAGYTPEDADRWLRYLARRLDADDAHEFSLWSGPLAAPIPLRALLGSWATWPLLATFFAVIALTSSGTRGCRTTSLLPFLLRDRALRLQSRGWPVSLSLGGRGLPRCL